MTFNIIAIIQPLLALYLIFDLQSVFDVQGFRTHSVNHCREDPARLAQVVRRAGLSCTVTAARADIELQHTLAQYTKAPQHSMPGTAAAVSMTQGREQSARRSFGLRV